MSYRTDSHNNPAAFTTDIAKQAGLALGTEYTQGDPFTVPNPSGTPNTYYTARLIGDPIALTIKVIDAIGYFTHGGSPRWIYAALPKWVWNELTPDGKRDMVGYHYFHEGGSAMRGMFPNYGKA